MFRKSEKQKLLESGKITVVCEYDIYDFIYTKEDGTKIPIVRIFGSGLKLTNIDTRKQIKKSIKEGFKDIIVLNKENLGE